MIIGLTGKKQSGKDTVAAYLVEKYGFERHGFADLLKEAVANLFDVDTATIEAWKNNHDCSIQITTPNTSQPGLRVVQRSYSMRGLLQRFGTEMGRETFDQDFWIDNFWDRYERTEKLVITDVRFDNEADSIIIRGGHIWKINRDSEETDLHASEEGIWEGYINHDIDNNGTFEDLYGYVELLLGAE